MTNKLTPHPLEEEKIVCGVDEAGAGCGFGPVVAASVILPKDWTHPLLNDSKKVTEKNRNILYDIILKESLCYSIKEVTALEIDDINILQARFRAMDMCIKTMTVVPEHVLIDGDKFYKQYDMEYSCVVKGDATYLCIAAASILAKVHRDRLIVEMSKTYNKWHLDNNKGYLTAKHIEMIKEHGLSPLHRKTFCKNFL